MNTFTSKARAAALAAGATVLAGAAMAPNANAWVNNTTACSGTSISAGGATFQTTAQYRWGTTILSTTGWTFGTTQFAALSPSGAFSPNPNGTTGFGQPSASALDCEGSGLAVRYAPTGSGGGRNSWRANGTTTRDTSAAFVTTDEGPDQTEQVNLQTSGMTSTGSTLETIPVAQGAIAFFVNPPAGCTATGRAVKLSSIEQVFEGDITTWGQLMPGKLTGASCNVNTPVTKYARSNSSGTTFAVKKTFQSIDADWAAYGTPAQNTAWPTNVLPGGSSNSALATTVANNAGSISYGDLASVRNSTAADYQWNGSGDTKYMLTVNVPLRGGSAGQTVSVDPGIDTDASNGISGLGSNCGSTRVYNNVPASTKGSLSNPATGNWFTVEGSNAAGYKSYEYPVCTLTYVLAYDRYARFPGMTEAQARTAYDYIRYIVSTNGQNLLAAGDYQKLPSALKTMANDGALRINW